MRQIATLLHNAREVKSMSKDKLSPLAEIQRLRGGLTEYGERAVAYWMERTGCSELEALRHVSGGPRLLTQGHRLGEGWH